MVLSSISTFQKMNHLKNEPLKPDPNLYLYSDTGEIGIISNTACIVFKVKNEERCPDNGILERTRTYR